MQKKVFINCVQAPRRLRSPLVASRREELLRAGSSDGVGEARHFQSGFTLIEIMVVLVIIGILMALVVPNVIGRPDEARITVAKTDLHAVASALDLYKLDNFDYPTTQQGLEALVSKPSGEPEVPHWKDGGYLKKLPIDPWGNPYQYLNPGTHGTAFDLYSLGPNGKPGQPDSSKVIGEWQQ